MQEWAAQRGEELLSGEMRPAEDLLFAMLVTNGAKNAKERSLEVAQRIWYQWLDIVAPRIGLPLFSFSNARAQAFSTKYDWLYIINTVYTAGTGRELRYP